jgi:hypothetical protein
MSRKKPLIYWGKSRLVFSHNLNHDQFCNTVDIQVIVSGHVETVCLLSNTQSKKKESYITLDVEMADYYRIKNEGKNSTT